MDPSPEMHTDIQIKEEPVELHEMDIEVNLKIENDITKEDESVQPDNFVAIKQELPNKFSVKLEPVDDGDNAYGNQEIVPEQMIMKLDPSYYDGEFYNNYDGKLLTNSRVRQDKDEMDDDYLPAKSKKKKKESNVKPLFKGKQRNDEQTYSDDITKHIEIVTIDEAERVVEHHDLFNSRKHMNYTCEPCALGFVIEDAYHMHMKIHSPENGSHACDICGARVKSADVLYRHRLRHYRRYRCRVCALRLRDKDTVAAHVMREHVGAAFVCAHCGRGFKRPQYLKRHVEQMHTRPLHLECPVCQRVFYERGWYRCHVRTHNEEVRKNIDRKAICSHCGREFRNKAYLIRHLQTHEDRQPVVCKHCSRTFKNIEVLRVHYRQHHSKNPLNEDGTFNENFTGRTYASQGRVRGAGANTTCAQCGRVLTTRAMLARHTQRMHTERVRKFQCDYCKKWYFTKAEVRSHIEWTHLQQRRHACACGRVFRTPARLRAHACAVHLRIAPPRDKTCPVCGKMFANQQVLTRHIKGHSGETYPCNECGQKFKTQSYVKIHYKLKHLKMSRAEIKAQSKRTLITVENSMDERMVSKIKVYDPITSGDDPLFINAQERETGVKMENQDISVPLFETFVDIQREC
ncbi:zinc finger protein 567-like isoform X1 [Vanessa atalanta]|uniref:zinc finger protein 567-like isoform X1 n=1 Tax=Vanessa atalanta TaxID=42275 RepID=UPI001FCD2F83|nr:zinc finger protein 567-like isoform X1 [Vanessa atalanta]